MFKSCWSIMGCARNLSVAVFVAVVAPLAHAQAPTITAETITPFQETLRRGQTLMLTYKFSATAPTSTAQRVFMHVLNGAGAIVLQDDHQPPTATTAWSDTNASPRPDVKYTRPGLTIPSTFPDGDYKIVVGLYNQSTNVRLALAPGARVSEFGTGTRRYWVGNLTITSRQIVNASFACVNDIYTNPSGWTGDVTATLQGELNSLASGTATSAGPIYKLPRGGCRYSSSLHASIKRFVDIAGAGIPDTVLHALDRTRSALVIYDGSSVTVRDLTIRTTKVAGDRRSDGLSRGIDVDRSSAPTIKRVRIENVAGAGISFYETPNSTALSNEVFQNEADGIHVTGALSSNALLDSNWASGNGDDSFSSIGYGTAIVSGTRILNNTSISSFASGVAVEGTSGAVVQGNKISTSGMAGIRVASVASPFFTGAVTNAQVSGNTLDGVHTRCNEDHAGVMIFADNANLSSITFSGNTIVNPRSADAIRVRGRVTPSLTVSGVTLTNNTITTNVTYPACTLPPIPPNTQNPPTNLNACITVGANVFNVTRSGNRWNGSLSACND